MRILIYGAGAVGQGIGGMLAAQGYTVTMVLRDRYQQVIARDGIMVDGIYGEHHGVPDAIHAVCSVDGLDRTDYDYVLITTKSFDTGTALADLVAHGIRGIFVSVQNGCGNLEKVIAAVGADRALAARVITGFEIVRPGSVRITVSADDIHIGGPVEGTDSESAAILADVIGAAGLPCISTRYIRRDLFAKLLYNCALNPLGAVLGVHYGALGDDADTRSIMNAVIDEVFSLISALGERSHWNTPDEYRAVFYDSLLPATYTHRSSMLQDIESGRKTEVDGLTGYVSTHARHVGVPTPVCDMLTALVKFRERQAISPR